MAIIGALDKTKHFDEFDDPLFTSSGIVSSATRKATALANLGVTATAAELNVLAGAGVSAAEAAVLGAVTANEDEINTLDKSAKFTLFEDFFGTWAIGDAGPADNWVTTAGSGTGNQVATTVAAALNGTVTLKSASDDVSHASNNSVINGIGLAWKANSGGLAIEARVKLDAITAVYLFVGFTDVAATTVECPIFMNAADLDSDADDAFGVIFDTDATSDFFTVGGVAATVDVTPVVSALAPTANTYVVIRVECSAAGVVEGFIDGVSIGSVAAGVTVTTALTPAIVIGNRGAAQRIATIDYIKAEQNRVAA
jgi:hypothetical protein